MLISLSEIMNLSAEERKCTVSLGTDRVVRSEVTYPIIKKEDVVLHLTNLGGRKVKIKAESQVTLTVPCDRCLQEVAVGIPISVDTEVNFNENEKERIEDLNETSYINGYDLDVDRMVYEEILLGFPMKVLCQEDCKGICKVCGANLNQGECGCDRTEPDPRMSVIRDIFNNVKEV